jgi:hypothetical protein
LQVEERDQAFACFYDRWQTKPVILDAWFALEASAPRLNGLERVQQLLEHPRFDPLAPNSLRAVLGGFTANVPVSTPSMAAAIDLWQSKWLMWMLGTRLRRLAWPRYLAAVGAMGLSVRG